MQAGTVIAHPRLSLPQIAKAASVPPAVVRHMVQAELVPTDSALLLSGRHSRSVHLDQLPHIRTATDGALSLEKTARMLSLPERRLRDLIAGGHLTPLISRQINRGAAAWLIPKSEIDRFQVPCTLVLGTSNGIAVRNVLKYWRLRNDESCALITAVIDGHLLVAGDSQQTAPIGVAVLSATKAKEWLSRYRDGKGEDLTVDAAAKVLGIKQQTAYDLVRHGLLARSTSKSLGHRVFQADLDLFRTTYVSLASLARERNRSPRALMGELTARPVCGPSINGIRQYFYRRLDMLDCQPNGCAGGTATQVLFDV